MLRVPQEREYIGQDVAFPPLGSVAIIHVERAPRTRHRHDQGRQAPGRDLGVEHRGEIANVAFAAVAAVQQQQQRVRLGPPWIVFGRPIDRDRHLARDVARSERMHRQRASGDRIACRGARRTQPLATPTVRLHWRVEGDVAIWQFREIYRDMMSDDISTFLTRQQMKMTFTHIRDAAGTDNLPMRALFALPENEHAAQDVSELSCDCLYQQEANELHYPAGILESTPELGNRLTRTMLEETCERLIGQSRISSGLSGEVYQLLLSAPGKFPSMTAVAAQLGLQERTLRRRLASENLTYGSIVDDVRRKLAIEYLQTTRMSVDDVAWKVGFSDGANLRRAVRRWTSKTINQIRKEN